MSDDFRGAKKDSRGKKDSLLSNTHPKHRYYYNIVNICSSVCIRTIHVNSVTITEYAELI